MNLNSNMYKKNILDINYKKLKSNGINTLIYDFDNTIIERHNYKINNKYKELFEKLVKDFNVVVLSNTTRKKKIALICNELKITYYLCGFKPLKIGFKKILKKYKLKNNQIAVIGDQIYTDIKGGNKMNFFTVLVDPINNDENIFTKFNRKKEDRYFARENKIKRGKYYE